MGIKQLEENPWENIRNDFTAGKVVNGNILKVLDKGIIFELGNNLEVIFPIKRMKKHEKNHILTNFNEGDSHEVTVQEVDEEYKKIILMMDLGLDGELDGEDSTAELDSSINVEAESEKLEIPQEIIDQVSDDTPDESDVTEENEETPDEVAEVEETDEAVPEAEDVKDDDAPEADESKDESQDAEDDSPPAEEVKDEDPEAEESKDESS